MFNDQIVIIQLQRKGHVGRFAVDRLLFHNIFFLQQKIMSAQLGVFRFFVDFLYAE